MDRLVDLEIYYVNSQGAVRRSRQIVPDWAWLRKNRGSFDSEPRDAGESVEIIAEGRKDWIGWVELAKGTRNEVGTRMTARVINDVDADVLGIIEAEDRPSLVRMNKDIDLLNGRFAHVMLVDGNDERGIDVGLMTKAGFNLGTIRSNVDAVDANGNTIFSRDCPEYEVRTPGGNTVYFLVNHFKSQSFGGAEKRLLQAGKVREIAAGLVAEGKHVVVMGDLNEGPRNNAPHAENLAPLYATDSRLVECYSLANFDLGGRDGTFDTCSLNNRLDYIFVSQSLQPFFTGGGVFRRGLWGSRKTRPTNWQTYPEMTESVEQASDHAAIFIDLDLA
jgi:endonuclease/exonuclease/phosphatase family metal-dependent hydrolase